MRPPFALVVGIVVAAGCGNGAAPASYAWNLPPNFPTPLVPADNPMTAGKVALGRYLFYDVRLSGNGTMSCGTCHQQKLAFTDGLVTPVGSTGHKLARNSMPLANVAYSNFLTWANPLLNTLEEQMLVPMFGDSPIELGIADVVDQVLGRLRADPLYVRLFADAFPGDANAFTLPHVIAAIACFERTILSGRSPYDRFQTGDTHALNESAQRGMAAFFQEKLDCYHCHSGTTFSSAFVSTNAPRAPRDFRNNGIYNIDGKGGYPANNTGLYGFTQIEADMGRFRVPTLRNIALTAPYFHDGSAATLDDVIDNYAHGGRVIASGPFAGDGSKSPRRDPLVKGFTLGDDERADLKAFLESLTDDELIHDPALSDPFH